MREEEKNELTKAFVKMSELNRLIGEDASLWEMGFIACYVKFMEDQSSAMSLSFHVNQGKELMNEMLKHDIIEDRTDALMRKVSLGAPEKNEKEATVFDYVGVISQKVVNTDKNDGNHQFSKAVGIFELDEMVYEIKIVLEPREKEWLGEDDMPKIIKVQ